jgi:hypothetical protein
MLGLFRAYLQRTSGFSSASFYLYRMRAGKIVEHVALRDYLSLLRQLDVLSG